MSKKVRAATTAALILATMTGAHAQGKDDVTGNFYLPYCRSFLEKALVVPIPMQTMNEGMCAGVVYSIRVVAPFLSPNMRSCPPDANLKASDACDNLLHRAESTVAKPPAYGLDDNGAARHMAVPMNILRDTWRAPKSD